MNRAMSTSRQRMRQRMTLWRIARQLRAQDPELVELLSGRRASALPPLRFRSIPVRGYALVGVLLLVTGIFLSVGSAVVWGTAALLAAAVRYHVQPLGPGPAAAHRPRPEQRRFRET